MSRAAVVLAAIAIAIAAYLSAIPGGFVSDDDVQIVQNPHVTDPALLGRALVSDVWGFTREDSTPQSHYWRPLFLLWLVANHRLFGLAPAGWHVASLLLHCAVVVAAAAALRRLELRPAVAAAALWIFAAHPVHVESVAWASGAPDLLMSLFLLAAWSARRAPVALGLFACALLSKETAIVYPALLFLHALPHGARVAVRRVFPYLAVAATFVALRMALLGRPFGETSGAGALETLSLLPEAVFFYIRQALWPAALSPVHPLERNAFAWVALLAALAIGALLWKRSAATRAGLALFGIFLAPVLFGLPLMDPDRLVQDRYLYLPLLGLAIVAAQAASDLLERATGRTTAGRALLAGGMATALLLAFLTFRYNVAWWSDIALWERAVVVHPESTYALGTLGFHYRVADRPDEARSVLERARAIDPDAPQVLLDLAILDSDVQRYRRAERLLVRALRAAPEHETIPDHLGRVLLARGEAERAAEVFRAARERHPHLRLKNTINLALTLRAAGRLPDAVRELESVEDLLWQSEDPTLRQGLVHLGEMRAQLARD